MIKSLVDKNIIKSTEEGLVSSTIITLKSLEKVVSGATARSVRTESDISEEEATISVFAGSGMKYIIEGKPANTKYPIKKEGGKFVLVDELRYWKKLVGFKGSDFILARTIATKKRDGIDVGGMTIKYFKKTYLSKINNSLLALTILEVKQAIKR